MVPKINRERALSLVLLCASTGIVTLAAEIFLRVLYPAPDFGPAFYTVPHRRLFQYDSLTGWRGLPDIRSTFTAGDFRVTVTHDGLGFRKATGPVVSGSSNILVLGDSRRWGWGVEDDEVFTSVLAREHPRLNAYNLSARGFGTDQELLTLRRFLTEHPDASFDRVVLVFTEKDFADVIAPVRFGQPKPRYELVEGLPVLRNVPVPDDRRDLFDGGGPDASRSADERGRPSHLFNFLWHQGRSLINGLRGKDRPPAESVALSAEAADGPHPDLVVALLLRTAAIAADHGASFNVVLLPYRLTTTQLGRLEGLGERLSAEGLSHSFFWPRALLSPVLWMDGHSSRTGHTGLARDVAGVLDVR